MAMPRRSFSCIAGLHEFWNSILPSLWPCWVKATLVAASEMAINGAAMWIRVFICNPAIQNCPRRHSCRPTFRLLAKTRIATQEVFQIIRALCKFPKDFPLVVSWFELISVCPLCSLCLGGESLLAIAHHRVGLPVEGRAFRVMKLCSSIVDPESKLSYAPVVGREGRLIIGALFRSQSLV